MRTPWWQSAVFYHIYVRSFQDSNDDGIGDLPGLLSRLEVIAALGVDALWLSPFYPSPQSDFGYDVADFCNVDAAYGSMDDLAALRDALHDRGMRLILDFVPNHTSDHHAWFRNALQGRVAPMRDHYIWRDPAPDGGPPNNWISIFGGPAWTLHESSGQYYLHSFLPQQPDLNWRNPKVVAAMHGVLRFWLDWGADGFRVDAVHQVIKDAELRSNPPNADYSIDADDPAYDPFAAMQHVHDAMQPEVYDIVRGMRRLIDEYDDRVLVGETPVLDWSEYAGFVGDGSDLFHLAFNFHPLRARSLGQIRRGMEGLYAALDPKAWPTLVLSNHDVDRQVSRLSEDGAADDALAKAAAATLLLGRGTPFVYYGDEIGMPNGRVESADLRDPVGIFERQAERRIFFSLGFPSLGRDPERTPMPWTAGAYGDFSTAKPWLPTSGFEQRNVERHRGDQHSVWHWYRRLLAIRREHPALQLGSYTTIDVAEPAWAFERRHGEDTVRVLINSGKAPAVLDSMPDLPGEVIIGTDREPGDTLDGDALHLAPWEVVVLG
ncbi:MAG: alpha-amylase family glycosyl hydrolase [Myxococcota bacterium]